MAVLAPMPEGKGAHGHRGVSRRPSQLAQRVTDVLDQGSLPRQVTSTITTVASSASGSPSAKSTASASTARAASGAVSPRISRSAASSALLAHLVSRSRGARRLHHAVGVEDEPVSRQQRGGGGLVARVRKQPQHGAAPVEALHPAVRAQEQRRRVACVRVRDRSAWLVEDGVGQGDEAVGGETRGERAVEPLAHLVGRQGQGHEVPQRRVSAGHEQRRRSSLAADVRYGDPEAAAGQSGELVGVAAELLRETPRDADGVPRHIGHGPRKQAALHVSRIALQPLGTPQVAARGHLGAERRQQACVVPRLLHEVGHAVAHDGDRERHRRPRSHDHHGQGRIEGADTGHQLQPLAPRGRVPRVVEVHDQGVEPLLRLQRRQHVGGRGSGLHREAMQLEQETEGGQHVRLIVRDQDASGMAVGERVRCVGHGLEARRHSDRRAARGSSREARRAGR